MKIFIWSLFGIGLFLLGINILGEFKTLRNPDIYKEDSRLFKTNADIKYEDIQKDLTRRQKESDKEYALRINDLVYRGMLYYWHEEGIKKYHLSVPVWENYLLFLNNSLKSIDKYEFRNWKKNLERGVGLCSAYANVLQGILIENNIESRTWELTRHIVVEAKVSQDEWIVLDPNYGVFIPYSMKEIKAQPELVRPTYKNMADLHTQNTYKEPYTTDLMVEIYGYEETATFSPDPGFENFTYFAIWALPLLLLSVSGGLIFFDKNRKHKNL